MPIIRNIVNSATMECASTSLALPYGAHLAFSAFHNIHRAWRWIRLGNIYSDPNNFANLVAGHGMNYMIGDSTLVRISAIAVLISTRILHAVNEYEKLQDSWIKMQDAFYNRYPKPAYCSWDQKHGALSISTVIWIKSSGKTLIFRIQRIAVCIFNVGKHGVLLSFRLIDAVEAFSLKPEIREEGINLLFVNTTSCIGQLAENKEFLLNNLKSNREVIEKVLSGLGSTLTADALIETVESALEKAGVFHRSVETVNDQVGEVAIACLNKWGYEFFRGLGLRHLAPHTLIPPPVPPWEDPKRKVMINRFPPDDWLKIPVIKNSPKPLEKKVIPHKTPSNLSSKPSIFNIFKREGSAIWG